MSRDPNTWFLVIFLRQIYNEQDQVGQKEIQNVQLWKEKNSDKVNITTNTGTGRETVTVKAITAFTEGKISTKPHPIKL